MRVATSSEVDLQINPETWFDRLAKWLGIAVEFQTGDRALDAAVYLRGEVDSKLGMVLRGADTRAAIKALFSAACTQIRHEKRWLQVDWMHFDPAKQPLPGATELNALSALAALLPERSSVTRPRRPLLASALAVLSVTLGLSFFLGMDYAPVRWGPLWSLVLPTAAALWCLYAFLAAMLLRGHSRAHDAWGVLVAITLATALLGSIGAIEWCNGHFDRSPVVERRAHVLEKFTTRNKSRTIWHLRIADWAHPDETLDYHINSAEFDTVVPGRSTLTIKTRAGRLGVEWQLPGYRVTP